MRTTESHRNTEPLRRANHDISALLSWGSKNCEGQEIRRDTNQDSRLVRLRAQAREIRDIAARIGVLHETTNRIGREGKRARSGDRNLNTKRLGAGRYHGEGLRMNGIRDEVLVHGALALGLRGY